MDKLFDQENWCELLFNLLGYKNFNYNTIFDFEGQKVAQYSASFAYSFEDLLKPIISEIFFIKTFIYTQQIRKFYYFLM